jgi:hypothetical protein
MARNLAGADYVITGIGGLVGIGSSAHSLWAICRRGADGAWHTPLSIETSANASKLSLQFSNTNTIQLIIGTSNKDTTVAINSADGWVLAGVSRASGSSVPRGHKYVYSTGTWTHTDAGAATGGDSTDLTGGRAQIGRWQTTDFFNGDILEVGAVKRALTDGEWEQLPYTLKAAVDAVPDGLWLLDQHATTQSVIDLTGNGANQTGVTNTSVATTSVPIWSYGAGATVSVGHAGGSQSAAAGTATETDAAVALGRLKTRAVGTTAEADAAVAITRRKTRTVGVSAETDVATALGRAKTKTVGTATSTEAAQPLGRAKTKLLGTAAETDTALPVTAGGVHLVGRADETDSAAALGRTKTRTVGTATALEAALPLACRKARLLGTALELDTAVALVGAPARDLQLTVGPPLARWTAGLPTGGWSTDEPRPKWATSVPEV